MISGLSLLALAGRNSQFVPVQLQEHLAGADRVTTQRGAEAQLLRPPVLQGSLLHGSCAPSGSAWLRGGQLAAQGTAVWNSQMAVWNLCCAGKVQTIVSVLAEWLRESQHSGARVSCSVYGSNISHCFC